MDRDHLTRLIDEPSRVQRDDIADLKTMAERYPWFSGAHLLLAVGGHREGDVLFDEQLRTSAAHLPSRAVLFDRLRAPVPVAPTAIRPSLQVEPVTVPQPPDLVVDAPGLANVVEIISTLEPEPPVAARPVVEEIAQDIVPEVPEAMAATEDVPTPGSISAEPPLPEHVLTPWKERLLRGDRDEEELDRQMRDSAVAVSYELLLGSESVLVIPPVGPVPVSFPEPPIQAPPPVVETRPQARASRSFTDWLSEGSAETTTPATAQSSHTPKPSVVAPTDPEIVRAVQQVGPVASKHSPETPETKALIERFLQQNTQQTVPAKRAEFFNPQTAAKRSLEEHADLVTETLARIYEKQGNISKAIAAYERLAVKHPEKSAHFRALAKALTGR